MEIRKFKKIGNNKYKISFEDNEIILYEDVILKYNLLINKKVDMNTLENVIEENKKYEIYDIALKYIGIKMRTKKELEIYLLKKDFDSDLIKEIIEKIDNEGYLNEREYVSAFINDSINLKMFGPLKIKEELLRLGINEGIIDEHIKKVDDSIWIEKIEKYISKISSINKKYSLNMLKLKILNDLYLKGYEKEMIYNRFDNIKVDEDDNLKNEFNKAYKKYSTKFKDKELNEKIISYLQRKGYAYYQIEKFLK